MKVICKTKLLLLAIIIFMVSVFSVFSAEEAQAGTGSCLFVGNSLTYFNNVPEMYRNMVAAGQGVYIDVNAAVYSNRTLAMHANAINAVIRTKGRIARLTDTEKGYFCDYDTGEYDPQVYVNYADLFWDYVTGSPRHYDRIVLQTYYRYGHGDISVSRIYNALYKIIKAINDPSTDYVLNVTSANLSGTINDLASIQTGLDQKAEKAVANIRSTAVLQGMYKSITIAYTGRAFCNYLYYTGTKVGMTREPGAYLVLNQYLGQLGYANDLFCGDKLHYTILGSYLETATLYSAVYGYAQATAYVYKGGSYSVLRTLHNSDCQNFSIFYNYGNGFTDITIPPQITFLADATMQYGMNLKSSSMAKKWKKNMGTLNYYYMNVGALVTFDGNGATESTFTKQRFFYGKSGLNFDGTISRTGYDMLGWSLSGNAVKARYRVNSSVTDNWILNMYAKKGGKVTLYAVWKPHTLKVSFDGNYRGAKEIKEQNFTYDSSITRLSADIEREGYELLGWALSEYADSPVIKNGFRMTNYRIELIYSIFGPEVTLYAVWAKTEEPDDVYDLDDVYLEKTGGDETSEEETSETGEETVPEETTGNEETTEPETTAQIPAPEETTVTPEPEADIPPADNPPVETTPETQPSVPETQPPVPETQPSVPETQPPVPETQPLTENPTEAPVTEETQTETNIDE